MAKNLVASVMATVFDEQMKTIIHRLQFVFSRERKSNTSNTEKKTKFDNINRNAK